MWGPDGSLTGKVLGLIYLPMEKTTPKQEMIEKIKSHGLDPADFDCIYGDRYHEYFGAIDNNGIRHCPLLEMPDDNVDFIHCHPRDQEKPQISFKSRTGPAHH